MCGREGIHPVTHQQGIEHEQQDANRENDVRSSRGVPVTEAAVGLAEAVDRAVLRGVRILGRVG
jgi:hypothetical protein